MTIMLIVRYHLGSPNIDIVSLMLCQRSVHTKSKIYDQTLVFRIKKKSELEKPKLFGVLPYT